MRYVPKSGHSSLYALQRLLNYIKPDVVHVLAQGKSRKPAGRNWRCCWKKKVMPNFTGMEKLLERLHAK